MTLLKAGKTIDVDRRGARDWWCVKGYSMAFGARFLKRFIDEQIKLPISAQWKDGTHFDVKVKDGALVVEPAVAKMSTPDDTLAYGDVA